MLSGAAGSNKANLSVPSSWRTAQPHSPAELCVLAAADIPPPPPAVPTPLCKHRGAAGHAGILKSSPHPLPNPHLAIQVCSLAHIQSLPLNARVPTRRVPPPAKPFSGLTSAWQQEFLLFPATWPGQGDLAEAAVQTERRAPAQHKQYLSCHIDVLKAAGIELFLC